MFDFPQTVTEIEDVPPQFQGLYEEKEEVFTLIEALSDKFTGTPSDSATQEELEAYRALGEAPQGLKKKLEEKDQAYADLLKFSDLQLMDLAASTAITEAKGNVPLLLPHVRSALNVAEEAGKRVVQVLKKEGELRLKENGQSFSVSDLLAEMKETSIFVRAFESMEKSGGGMSPSTGQTVPTKISRQDQSALNARLEEIAAGKVSVS